MNINQVFSLLACKSHFFMLGPIFSGWIDLNGPRLWCWSKPRRNCLLYSAALFFKPGIKLPFNFHFQLTSPSHPSALICSQQQFEADRKYVLTLQECSLAPLSCVVIATVKTYTYQTALQIHSPSNLWCTVFECVHSYWRTQVEICCHGGKTLDPQCWDGGQDS